MTPKAVFWDMDGTLVDSEPLHEAALVAALRSVGVAPPVDLHERVLGVAAWPVYEMLRDEFGLDLPFDEWIVRKYDHYLPLAETLKPRPGAIEVFNELRALGVEQAVVSNSDRLIVDANLTAVGLIYPGMRTVSRNDVIDGKPLPEPFLRAAYLAGVDPAEAFAVDDSVTGAMAGLAAGMRTIFWPEAPMAGPPGAIVINSAEELRAQLGL
ncbi:HAD family phosphatase [Mesorhizobium sp. M2D.F.Ca.ET.185.01.1.1]|uniref:HAD family hydrolase n=1 Tax=unclassified Mesorhizobium TaxID=325217 RepID=UPI000FCC02DD|nr:MULTISPECIES: HAD family phosphatase [unclassified Mesorhizobium]TGP51734.1 HAD family phosphatase [bacterium M00.F.Ca.ET.230.01.1.1]TGP82101.1 HAD family phosphatase [bacterium M00.F.Ca.ET.227.01.1.1]TGP92016.1 HAD family phosphatase [bacterium M00.F.Ca.ET.221.01.1.1]TGP95199.1 HAD family phosphatase [bacterium M00.F.Ca.ET.222.01.1.1]TGT71548.1 HAD family phosphatase [bacterium M00.F.Ca.ET.159.01.1.1]TGT83726.1 HAD family phosphatase [bacterium M00.F.Ca.ET.157.01.1.1]TGU09697.1 HAD famil